MARLLRLGEITSVAIPTIETEAARDLVRVREDCRGDLMAARQRLSKLLLRHGIVYSGGTAWTGPHDVWLRTQALPSLPRRATQLTFDAYYDSVLAVTARRGRLDAAIQEMAADSEFTPVVRRLGCLRGIGTLTGFALAVEIGDWDRFTGSSIGSFVGLVPSESSSGASRCQGSITKAGRQHPRPSAPGRGGLAPPARLPGRGGPATPLGPVDRAGTNPRRRRQPALARPVGAVP
ncbi:MAG: transposase [Candidatus Phosphoribacter sp.]